MSTQVGDVIQPGETIPDNVTGVTDAEGGRYVRTVVSAATGEEWLAVACGDQCVQHGQDEMRHPLTVTAVREPEPAEPDDVHYYFTELRTGLTYCGLDALEEDGVLTTSETGKATCAGCLAAAGEDPPGCPRCGTILNAERAHCADPWHADNRPAEPQQSETVPEVLGPLRLTLPEVPEGTVGATGHQRWRIVKVPGIALPCWQSDLVGPLDLGAMLDAEPDGVTVELAPPREPRTWPALKPGPSPVDLPEYVTVQGWGGYGLRSDGLYANTDGYADDVGRESCHTFDSLRALGDLVEADENGDPA